MATFSAFRQARGAKRKAISDFMRRFNIHWTEMPNITGVWEEQATDRPHLTSSALVSRILPRMQRETERFTKAKTMAEGGFARKGDVARQTMGEPIKDVE
jgi:hypothetical protein